jgi:hypothetical protein
MKIPIVFNALDAIVAEILVPPRLLS